MGRRIQRSAWPRHSCPSFIVADEIEVLFLIEPWLLSVLTPAGAIASPHWQVLPVAGGGFDRGLAALTLTQPLHGITFALPQPACMRLLVANVPSQLAATAQALYGTVAWARVTIRAWVRLHLPS